MNKIKNLITEDFTIIPNGLIRDVRERIIHPMSLAVFNYMASRPDDWEFNNSDLCKFLQIEDERTLRKYVHPMIDRGWISRERLPSASRGKFNFYEYTIHGTPGDKKCTLEPGDKKCTPQKMSPAKDVPHTNKELLSKKEFIIKKIDIEKAEDRIDCVKLIGKLPTGDTPENRLEVWRVIKHWFKCYDFAGQWQFLTMGVGSIDPEDGLHAWVLGAEWYMVKELKINKAKNWVKNAKKDNSKTIQPTGKAGGKSLDISGNCASSIVDQYLSGCQ